MRHVDVVNKDFAEYCYSSQMCSSPALFRSHAFQRTNSTSSHTPTFVFVFRQIRT